MNVATTELPGVLLIDIDKYTDSRGSFLETWNRKRYGECGLPSDFVQDNVSYSKRGVLRGLHFQNPHPQGKLVQVLEGEVFDVAVDIRVGSPSFGKWYGVVLSSDKNAQLYIPEGFAHGFLALSELAVFSYKCTEFYNKSCERSIRWDDPDIAIKWPLNDLVLSDKDRAGYLLKDIPQEFLFRMVQKL